MAPTSPLNKPFVHIRPARNWNGIDLRAAWVYRDIVLALARREIQVRYRQTIAGVLWVLGQPILTTLVTSVLLIRLAGQSQQGIPYPIFVYVALVPWAYFSHALTKSTSCFVDYSGLVTAVYIHRYLIPLAVVLAALVDFGVAFIFVPLLMLYYQIPLTPAVLFLPVVIVLMLASVFGLALWLSSLNAEFRDILFALPFALQLGLFVTPMFYSSDIVPLPWRYFYALNPMVGVVEGMRFALLNPPQPISPVLFLISSFAAVVVLASGLYIFQRRAPNLADVI